jgi:aminopeptidase
MRRYRFRRTDRNLYPRTRRLDRDLLTRYADLIVEVGANVQPGQVVWIVAEPSAAPLVRLVAAAAYERGARFVDPWYFDPYVKRARLEHADPSTLASVPPWYGERLLALGEGHGVRISITPQVPPGVLTGIDPAVAGRDALPAIRENFEVINARTTNWTVVPWASPEWARTVFPALPADDAVERLWEQLIHVLRLDESDPREAWRLRLQDLHEAGRKIDAHRFDAVRFDGPGTELTVGLLPTSRFSSETPGMRTIDGIVHAPNLPTEEIATTPDPLRVDGTVTATKPLDVAGTLVTDLTVRFEAGRAVEIDGANAGVLRARASVDDGASRLGEVALVDGSGRIGKTQTVFFNTLLDENAASHIALGNGYAISVGDEDRARINTSEVHIDFMIGSDDVTVTGIAADGSETTVLRDGAWQI